MKNYGLRGTLLLWYVLVGGSSLFVVAKSRSQLVTSLPRRPQKLALPADERIRRQQQPSLHYRSTDSAWVVGMKNSVASAMAAGCSKVMLAPFDTIKTIQQHSRSAAGSPLSMLGAAQVIMKRPKGVWELYVSPNHFKENGQERKEASLGILQFPLPFYLCICISFYPIF
jgi:hypothetical protein